MLIVRFEPAQGAIGNRPLVASHEEPFEDGHDVDSPREPRGPRRHPDREAAAQSAAAATGEKR